jgi:glucose-6-phosphate isomerase
MIETFVIVDSAAEPALPVPAGDDADELGYLTGRPLAEINHAAYQATSLAHRDGGVPNMTLTLSALDAHSLGFLLYFFERACGVSGYLLGVNPFDQPGVEAYKKNMFALLAKPGHESETKRLQEAVEKAAADSIVTFG